MKEKDIKQKLRDKVVECMISVPFVNMVEFKDENLINDNLADEMVRISIPGIDKVIIVEIKRSGQPRYVRQAVSELFLYKNKFPGSYAIFAAPYISPQSADICREAGIGYVDLGGNCLISFENIFIKVEGKKNPYPQKRDLKTMFSPKSSRIIRVLLLEPFKTWKTEELSKVAEVSLGQVANVKKKLLEREWIKEENVGFVLTQAEQLIKEWAAEYNFRKNQVFEFYSLKEFGELEQGLNSFCTKRDIRFALTLFSGVSKVAPYTRYKQMFSYIEGNIEEAKDELGLKSVESGSNVTLMVPFDSGVFYGTNNFQNIPVVSPIQLYVDLKSYRGRGEEAAEHLYREVIEPLWSQKPSMNR